ncbi:MAG: hypothetical protein QXR53_00445 [Candidatus Norongarragalinales archaeon]
MPKSEGPRLEFVELFPHVGLKSRGRVKQALTSFLNHHSEEQAKRLAAFIGAHVLHGKRLNQERVTSFYKHVGFFIENPQAVDAVRTLVGEANAVVGSMNAFKRDMQLSKAEERARHLQSGHTLESSLIEFSKLLANHLSSYGVSEQALNHFAPKDPVAIMRTLTLARVDRKHFRGREDAIACNPLEKDRRESWKYYLNQKFSKGISQRLSNLFENSKSFFPVVLSKKAKPKQYGLFD